MVDSLLRSGVAALALFALTPAHAQEIAPPPTPNADALATQMRILGSNPRNVTALLTAAELSTRLGDAPAALAFLARAQAVEPSNPRINAGRASAMVLLERPGEALRLFDQAARAGVPMDPYLLHRGLAYDLTGQPGYAQRDYRRLLQQRGSDDEAVRRLALSLGISGERDEAMALLDPLLRRSDRGAWRARACILAMGGDTAGAQKIATSMIPGGAGLAPFFTRLQALSAADRAFAVHFGQVTPTIARANDARLAPQVAALPARAPQPSAAPPVAVASAPAAPPAAERLSRRDRQRAERRADQRPRRWGAQLVSREPIVPAQGVNSASATTGVPVSVAAISNTSPAAASVPRASTPIAGRPVTVAASQMPSVVPAPRTTTSMSPAPAGAPVSLAAVSGAGPVPRASVPISSRTEPAAGTATVTASSPAPWSSLPTQAALPSSSIATGAALSPVTRASAAATSLGAPVSTAAARLGSASAASPRERSGVATAVVAATPDPLASAVAPVRTAAVARRNTDLLAAIVAGISVPGSELGVAPPVEPAPEAVAPPPPAATRTAPAREAEPPAEPKKVEAKKADAKKPEPKKTEAKKVEAKKPDPAKAEPARWFVQVAGGANAADLGKDWKRISAKSPAAFRGKSAWTTPLRATNRLLAGPFASQEAAMTFVNQLAKDGSSAFAWKSEAGQEIEKLPTR